ncbi:energy-coupling factor transporter ATPase [Flavonifractor sp. DFI.6.63]|uniref:ABC transporter ATP-binding protein n=1 Tax=Lawsonibacter hominis TaxID=2763053 RepID=A0A8J6J488_9FIRM|nr:MULTISPECIES: energy-coupling factor transporter ATPase [Oscillospiraceae]MBS1383712.1 energy-coupling factor transporter ATPase [Flavonifractor sp.]MDU2194366.1 energy-coupling factor transporter ATPase [Clostridiales bacterium]MDY2976024.1 energy-coupling factor transporter ATPase [Oscillospiraceae bacterium]MBC5732431.1 energy-coupling factor transporter ATPase [Lawsonibacter hominis]MCI6399882.1 energy-coupling factor transporter ATPase [Lawsonibacter sp.]
MSQSIIKTQQLRFSYAADEGSVPPVVLDGVDLEIAEGSFVAVLGHNGSGKSTLAKHMNAILLPTGGKVYVSGIDTADEDALLDIRRTVGMVFQNPDNQIVANVVEEDVAFAPENLGVPSEEIRRRVDEALRQVGMYEYREHAPHLLSGGQKQRVAIAGVIAMRPRCIVLDEPTAMLDPIGRSEVMKTIRALNRTSGVTVVLITHHMDEAAMADRLVVMAKGKIVSDGPPRQVFRQVEALKSVGLTVPETTELLWQLRQAGVDVPLDALSDEECAQALYRLLQ